MNVEKMTKKSLESIEMAQNTAIKHNHSQIDTIHLHYGLIEDESGLVSSAFQTYRLMWRNIEASYWIL